MKGVCSDYFGFPFKFNVLISEGSKNCFNIELEPLCYAKTNFRLISICNIGINVGNQREWSLAPPIIPNVSGSFWVIIGGAIAYTVQTRPAQRKREILATKYVLYHAPGAILDHYHAYRSIGNG